MQETAWESLLLGKAIWGKQDCTLCLLINTNLPAQAQNFAGENDHKELEEEMKEQSSCQALPLIPTMPRMPDYCHKEKQFLFSSSSSQLMPEAQTDHPGELGAGDISASTHRHWQGCSSISFQLCFLSQDTNLSCWARPSAAVIIRFLLLFSSLPFSTQAIFMEYTTCDGLGDAFYRNSTN